MIAIAKSNQKAAFGYVILAQLKKEDDLPTLAATLESKNSPKADAIAEIPIMIIPNPSPVAAIAEG